MKLFIVKSKFAEFDEGTLLELKEDKLVNYENSEESVNFDDTLRCYIESIPDYIDQIKKLRKSERLLHCFFGINQKSSSNDDSACETSGNSKTKTEEKPCQLSRVFLPITSDIKPFQLQDVPNDTKEQLFKIQWKIVTYGYKIKYYSDNSKNYSVIKLLPGSVDVIASDIPEYLFTDKVFEGEDSGVIVNDKYVSSVKQNLVIKKNSSFIDTTYILKKDKCNCTDYKSGEYVRFKNGLNKCNRIIENCLLINGQHCLKLKSDNVGDEINCDCYILVGDIFKVGIKQLTKYSEGVIIDPSSIIIIKANASKNLKIDDIVEVALRDSIVQVSSVIWTGKVNDLDVVAVELVTKNKNFEFKGSFKNENFFDKPSYLIPVSFIRKKIPEENDIEKRMQVMMESLKSNDNLPGIYEDLKYILKNIELLRSKPQVCLDQILKLFKKILYKFKKEHLSTNISQLIEPKDVVKKIIFDCGIITFEIICKLSFMNSKMVDDIKNTLLDTLKLIFDDLDITSESNDYIKEIFSDIMIIFWNIIKHGNKVPDQWLNKMFTIFNIKDIDPNIKLAAALNFSFLLKNKSRDTDYVTKYLKETKQKISTTYRKMGLTENDIFMALGKIYDLFDLSVIPEITHKHEPLEILRKMENESAAVAEEGSVIKCDDFEACLIDVFPNCKPFTASDKVIKILSKVKNKSIYDAFLGSQDKIQFEKYFDIIMKYREDDHLLKASLEKCDVNQSETKYIITLISRLLQENNIKNIELIVNKIEMSTDEKFDIDLLMLAKDVLKFSEFDIFKGILKKCKTIDSFLEDGEIFLSLIIKEKFDENLILKAIEIGNFDIHAKNKSGEELNVLVSIHKYKNVFDLLMRMGSKSSHLYEQIGRCN